MQARKRHTWYSLLSDREHWWTPLCCPLTPERLDRVKTGRPPGRIEAKANAHRRGTADRPDERVGPDQGAPPGNRRDAIRAKQPEPEPTPTAEQGHGDRLHQKLGEDVALAGAHGPAQA